MTPDLHIADQAEFDADCAKKERNGSCISIVVLFICRATNLTTAKLYMCKTHSLLVPIYDWL